VDNFSKGQSNFETVLTSQKCVFGKVELCFNPNNKNRSVSKSFSSFFEKQTIDLSKQPFVLCFYCMKKSYSVRFCRVRNFFVPRGVLKWVPTNSNVPNDPFNAYGPKFSRGPSLVS